jgi:hypothetical protein
MEIGKGEARRAKVCCGRIWFCAEVQLMECGGGSGVKEEDIF